MRKIFIGILMLLVPATPGFAANYIELYVSGRNDLVTSDDPFYVNIRVHLDSPASSVTGSMPSRRFTLTDISGDGTLWEIDDGSLSDITEVTRETGPWVVSVVGSVSGNIGFTLDTSNLTAGSFFNPPTVRSPFHDQVNVLPNSGFSWSAPSDGATAVLVQVSVGAGSSLQEAILTSTPAPTRWNAPSDVNPGFNAFRVGYFRLNEPSKITEISSLGGIVWGNPPHAPRSWPDGVPLFGIGSEAVVGFTAGGRWAGTTDHGGGWVSSDWFGLFNTASSPWIYHTEHGWMYVVGNSQESLWFYTLDQGWLWVGNAVSNSVNRYFYRNTTSSWLYYAGVLGDQRAFLDLSTNVWEYFPKG